VSRVAVVTGASSGIGLACAEALLARGATVVAQARTQGAVVEALAARWGAERVIPVVADLASEDGCCRVVAAAGADLDLVVHAAGIWRAAPIAELALAELEEVFRVNTFSAYLLAREAARVMTRGSFIVIGSTAGQRGEPGHSPYAGAKAALWGLVQSLAQELAPRIRVNLVSPGWVRTPMSASALDDPARLARIVGVVPLGRVAEAEDIAAAVMFLADDAVARHLTGVDLPVSGGALLPMPRG
jgi:NAD(P)-dependent dehydrogenase (short-subunit alcohol dehydrogenase family)